MRNPVGIVTIMLLISLGMGGNLCLGQEVGGPVSDSHEESPHGVYGYGMRIRFETSTDSAGNSGEGWGDPQTMTGTFHSCSAGSLMFTPEKRGSGLTSIPVEDVLWIEVSRGRSSHAVPGALVGCLVGLAISAASQTSSHEDEFLGGFSDMEDNINRGVLITVISTLFGAGVGSAMGEEKWESMNRKSFCPSISCGERGQYQVSFGYSF